ncbi:Uncharacterised protein [Raoultella terrigena]|uniref:Uncharacterized protein n=1 Tax=Raoultella terrigena TaxID=577 RepID=A0A485BEW1_RAOTE|nr:Uncharacterised protein [Raoultella terrigena]
MAALTVCPARMAFIAIPAATGLEQKGDIFGKDKKKSDEQFFSVADCQDFK